MMDLLTSDTATLLALLGLVALDYALGLSRHLEAFIRRFEQDGIRIGIRTGGYALFLTGFFILVMNPGEIIRVGPFSLFESIGTALGISFVMATVRTATETEVDVSPSKASSSSASA